MNFMFSQVTVAHILAERFGGSTPFPKFLNNDFRSLL